MRRRFRLPTALAPLVLVTLAALSLSACKTHWDLEDRETTVEVWLEAPAAAQAEVSVPVAVYVGERRALDRMVRFPRGQTRIAEAPVYVRSGAHEITVRVHGREVARRSASVRHHAWVLVRIEGQSARVDVLDREPGTR
jgi:hypothetical protein